MLGTALGPARRKLLKYRFLRCVYGAFWALYAVYLLIWWLFPGVYALAYMKIEPFNAVLCAIVFVTNFLIFADLTEVGTKGFRVFEFEERIETRQKELKFLVKTAKEAVGWLKKWNKEGLDACELDELRVCLGVLDIDVIHMDYR